MTSTEQKVYLEAKECLGKHITLDPNVPNEVGCAEAVSFVLKNAEFTLPTQGIASTASLYLWLKANLLFERIYAPEQGAIIVSPTGYGNGSIEGHTGVLGAYGAQFPYQYGILSNNSDNGLFQEKWDLLTWYLNYGVKGGLPLAMFRAL